MIPHLPDDWQIMGHFIAQNDAGDAIGKGFAGHGFGINGFVVKMFTRNTQRYVEHIDLASSREPQTIDGSWNLMLILYYLPY
jgi:hypothetical protein